MNRDLRKLEILRELRQLETQLSPENLFCDGERPANVARRIGAKLQRERTELTAEYKKLTGQEPNVWEVLG